MSHNPSSVTEQLLADGYTRTRVMGERRTLGASLIVAVLIELICAIGFFLTHRPGIGVGALVLAVVSFLFAVGFYKAATDLAAALPPDAEGRDA